ncbi:MAG: hypothetical protein A2X35_04300 [Elusimicrobia bacterium GWA2_61_42]|nr:MAG: hypothetical protein A2X35_04300 [Elusimicrobia bacterium GWA2_61_42]OGR74621.1 MAG: hypothetical protein A2X38_05505 [Elusimicrobia bacterium GWC2_61_25]
MNGQGQDIFPVAAVFQSSATIAYSHPENAGLTISSGLVVANGAVAIGAASSAGSRLWLQGSEADNFHVQVSSQDGTGKILTVSKDGNVGIGTVTPVYPLSVYRAAGEGTFNFESGADGAVVQNRLAGLDSDSQNQVWATGMNITDGRAGFEVYDYTDGSARMYISTGTGHVGIGTNSPTAPLHVSADVFRVEVSSTIGASGTPCNVGDIRWDIDYIYVCVEADTWKRAALTTWP